MTPISAVIITKNEAANIRKALDALQWVDEIVVVDSGSRDDTVEICREKGCRVITTTWRGFGPTKQFAVDQARHDWVLAVDADEEVSTALHAQIREVLATVPVHHGYCIHRISSYLGRFIRYSGWQKDYPLRLFNRGRGGFNDARVHEQVRIDGSVGTLAGPLYHYPYPDIASHLAKIPRYARLGAESRLAAGKGVSLMDLAFRGVFKFAKMYVLRQGFRDGVPGLILAGMSAYGVALKYYMAWEMGARPVAGQPQGTKK